MAEHAKIACDSVKLRFESVTHSPQDKRSYRGLVLNNGMKIMLVSDATADKAAAALLVGAGQLHDSKKLAGLAHFCEHMLFLGTKKYPDENDYQKYLSANSGHSNAYTAADHTNYYFDVQPDKLEGALDRFSQFFVAPLFTESATEREVNAVNSEHLGNLKNDMWRMHQIERTLCDPNHPYHGFGTGNVKTLLEDPKKDGVDTRKELLKYHQNYYSSNLMFLSVFGKDSLDDLERMVVPMFRDVENKSLSLPEWTEHPYSQKYLGNWVKILPVKDIRSLHVSFTIADLVPFHKSNPSAYVSHLLGHEGKGSLLSELKNKGWVNTLTSGAHTAARGFGFFAIDVDFTEEGEKHIEEIVELMFQYINLLKSEAPQEWIHREVEKLTHISFIFKDKENPSSYVTNIATNLQQYSPDEVLSGPFSFPDFKPELIKTLVLDKLTPDNMNIAVVSRKFEGIVDQTEPWYDSKYHVEKFSAEFVDRLNNRSLNEKFSLPEKNDFIPSNFDVHVSQKAEKVAVPKLIIDEPSCRVWFKQDDEYLLPKCAAYFRFHSPYVYLDPWHWNMSHMYASLLRDALTEYVYDAELAGLRYSISNTKYSMELYVYGYNEKQHVLLERLADKMTSFKADPKRFEILKEAYIRGLRNFELDQPYQHAIYYANLLLSQRSWSKSELLQATDDLTMERFEKFLPFFLSALQLEVFVHGNADETQARKLVDIVRGSLRANQSNVKPLFASQLYHDREINIPEGSSYVFEAENTVHATSGIEMYLQCGMQDTLDNVMLELVAQILNEPCFSQLRTKESLGYLVASGVRRSCGTQGIRFIVQSDHSASYVESRIEAFIDLMAVTIKEMPDAEFEQHKNSLMQSRLERPKKLHQLAAIHWSEITNKLYNFERESVEVDALKTISKDQLLQFYEKLIADSSDKRKKLTVKIESPQRDTTKKDGLVENTKDIQPQTLITDVHQFRTSLPLYPLPQPFCKIKTPGVLCFMGKSRL